MLPVLPPPVRISVVYPLQPLLYIPSFICSFIFPSHRSCSYSHSLSGSSLLLGDCTSDALLWARLKLQTGFQPPFYLFISPNLWVNYSSENIESGCCYAAFSKFNQLSRFTRTFPGRKAEGRRTKGRDNSVKWDLNPCDCSCTGLRANGLKAPWRSVVCLSAAALCRPNPIWLF